MSEFETGYAIGIVCCPGTRGGLPVTGQFWPSVIPVIGWTNLGILPDGRAVHEDGIPARTEAGFINDAGVDPAAVPDTRVTNMITSPQGRGDQGHVHTRYSGEDDEIPLVSREEMLLIQAELQGGQQAIDLVNQLGAGAGLPLVTYVDPNNERQVRYMIFEERRRALYLKGRFVFTKIRNPDMFP